MNISALSNINFKSNTPVYHVYNTNKDGTITELNHELVAGPVLALVKRLNKKGEDTKEKKFFSRYIPDFKYLPLATGTYIGSNDIRKSTVLYGQDALNVKEFRDEYYSTDDDYYSKEEINDAIKRLYIAPLKKRTMYAPTEEQIGLVLHTKSRGKEENRYELIDVSLVSPTGRIIAELSKYKDVLPKLQPKDTMLKKEAKINSRQQEEIYQPTDEDLAAYSDYLAEKAENNQKLKIEEYPPRPEDLEEEFEDTDKYFAVPIKPRKLVQGELFSTYA